LSSAADEGTAPAPTEEAAGAEGDPVRDDLVATLTTELGPAVLESEVAGGDVWVRIDRSAWLRAGEVLRHTMGMDYFCFLSGLDWMVNPDLSGEKVWDPDGGASIDEGEDDGGAVEEEVAPDGGLVTGVAGGDTRFQVFARVFSTTAKIGITLKADLDESDPRVASWVGVYRGADWHERETWEMYGFTFDGHPGLRHMYLPGEFEGYPLRKDFPLLAREVKPWPGLVDVEAMPGEEAAPDGEAEGES
jgi:NADH-quinone oxidoreductase subunit C